MPRSQRKPLRKKPRLKHFVCKPCWEVKYCPYGPLVEFFPLASEDLKITEIEKAYKSWVKAVKNGTLKTRARIYQAIEKILCLEPDGWRWIRQFRTDELGCSIFGHICPVFFSAEPFTETKQDRRMSRTIPRDVMLQVVRRDGQACQSCKKNVPDDQVEFDHLIPLSRGGPTTAENLRLLCRDCNRGKADSLDGIVDPDPWGHKT